MADTWSYHVGLPQRWPTLPNDPLPWGEPPGWNEEWGDSDVTINGPEFESAPVRLALYINGAAIVSAGQTVEDAALALASVYAKLKPELVPSAPVNPT